jgi:hypothetical protein
MDNKLPTELNQTLMEQGFTENARVLVGKELLKARLDEVKKSDPTKKDKRIKELEDELA